MYVNVPCSSYEFSLFHFLGPFLTRVSIAFLKRAAQSPRMLLDSSTAPIIGINDQSPWPPMCSVKATTASGHLHMLLCASPIASGLGIPGEE